MLKKRLLSICCVVILTAPLLGIGDEEPVMQAGPPEVSARTKRLANEFKAEIQQNRLRKKTSMALDAIIKLAAYKLKRIGKKDVAEKLLYEWKNQYSLYLEMRDLGDHKPLSEWLANQYMIWQFWLGKDTLEMLRLSDINVINFALPVVFSCIDNVDVDEYRLHFVPLASVTSYWVSFWACVSMTWGTGFLYCSPISMGVEYLTKTITAPALNGMMFSLACKE